MIDIHILANMGKTGINSIRKKLYLSLGHQLTLPCNFPAMRMQIPALGQSSVYLLN